MGEFFFFFLNKGETGFKEVKKCGKGSTKGTVKKDLKLKHVEEGGVCLKRKRKRREMGLKNKYIFFN